MDQALLDRIAAAFPFPIKLQPTDTDPQMLETCSYGDGEDQERMARLYEAVKLDPTDPYPATHLIGQLVKEFAFVEAIEGDVWFRVNVSIHNTPLTLAIECDKIEEGLVAALIIARVLRDYEQQKASNQPEVSA